MHRSIALWGHPRSMSTAIERSFMERGDFTVFHEAFSYVYYMHEERAAIPHRHPLANHPQSYPDVKAMMETARSRGPVFHKDFAYHAIDHLLADPDYLTGQVNTFLIRDPEEAVLSYASIHPDAGRDVLGYAELARLFDRITDLTGTAPVVINAADLVADPFATLAAYCAAIDIPFLPRALRWSPGERPEWASWKEWHGTVAESRGLAAPARAYRFSYADKPHLRDYVAYCRPFYDHLDRYRLTILAEAAQ